MAEIPAIAVVGAGLIGRRHIDVVSRGARLAAIVDPDREAEQIAARNGVAWFQGMDECLAAARPDGVILATPNQMHVAQGLQCIRAGVPVLIEKPIANDVASVRPWWRKPRRRAWLSWSVITGGTILWWRPPRR